MVASLKTFISALLISTSYAQDTSNCIYPDANGSPSILNLTCLTGTKISGGTSTYNTYQYSPCAKEFKCKSTKCMINQINKSDGSCTCLMQWDDGKVIPKYFSSQQTWEYQYFSDNAFVRVWWICNNTANPYSIRFTGAEADGEYGIYIDSYLACNAESLQAAESAKYTSTKCDDMNDCSYNGLCTKGECQCFPQWKGSNCAELNVVPTRKDNGLHSVIDGQRVSSWGGSVVRDDNGTYWMYAAEMGEFCGINTWLRYVYIVFILT